MHLVARQSAAANHPSTQSVVVTEVEQPEFKAGLGCSPAAVPVKRGVVVVEMEKGKSQKDGELSQLKL
jgi:hypothetical protein